MGISFEPLFSPEKLRFFGTCRASITRRFARLSERCFDAPTARVIHSSAPLWTPDARRAAAAIRQQPNGNLPLLSGRRAHRLIEGVHDAVHDADSRGPPPARSSRVAPQVATADPTALTVAPPLGADGGRRGWCCREAPGNPWCCRPASYRKPRVGPVCRCRWQVRQESPALRAQAYARTEPVRAQPCATKTGPPDPGAASDPLGATGSPVDTRTGCLEMPLCGGAVLCVPCAKTLDRGWVTCSRHDPGCQSRAPSATTEAIVPYRVGCRFRRCRRWRLGVLRDLAPQRHRRARRAAVPPRHLGLLNFCLGSALARRELALRFAFSTSPEWTGGSTASRTSLPKRSLSARRAGSAARRPPVAPVAPELVRSKDLLQASDVTSIPIGEH